MGITLQVLSATCADPSTLCFLDPELKERFDRGDDPNDPHSGGQQPFQGSPFGYAYPPFDPSKYENYYDAYNAYREWRFNNPFLPY